MKNIDLKQLSKDFKKEDSSAFHETLTSLIRLYGVSELARDAHFNRISLWRFMRGEQDIKLATFMKILKVLGISVTFHSDSQTNKVLDFLKWKNLRLKEFEQFE